jgi:pimeloyl-ACP methyl ester carboxylesterase
VFIHGIGIGLYPYTNFLNELNSNSGIESSDLDEQVGIIAIEIMPVSFRITHSALSSTEMCAEIGQILLNHFSLDQKFILVSHSYGTVISTHLLKTPSIAPRIGPVMLIDPVSILLHLPDVAYNFTRRLPTVANEHQLYYFASMDPGVSHTLSRHFFWNENVLWKKDLGGRNVTVSLSGRDLIVDTQAVGRYLNVESLPKPCKNSGNGKGHSSGILIDFEDEDNSEEFGLRLRGGEGSGGGETGVSDEWKNRPWRGTGTDVLWFKDLDHAQVFDKPATRRILIDAIRIYCEDE